MRHAAPAIFLLAMAVRLSLLASHLIPRDWILKGAHAEVDAVARSLVVTGRYADPYIIPTGPTAHPLPIHTFLQALNYLVFGMTPAAAWARTIAGIAAFAAAAAILPWFAKRLGVGALPGAIGGFVAATIPLYGTDDVLGWLWNESMAALALAGLTAAYLVRWQSDSSSMRSSFLLGIASGAAFHLAPQLVFVVAGFLLFEIWWRRGRSRPIHSAILIAGAAVACLPWEWRVYRALGEPAFIRSNFGLELRIGNHEGARADIWAAPPRHLHPGNDPDEARLVRELGEARYMARVRDEAIEWIRTHPLKFASLTASRAWHIWFGPPKRPAAAVPVAALTLLAAGGYLRVRRLLTRPQRAAVLIPLLTYPLVFYVVAYVPRYVFPLHGLLLLLAACLVAPASSWQNRQSLSAA